MDVGVGNVSVAECLFEEKVLFVEKNEVSKEASYTNTLPVKVEVAENDPMHPPGEDDLSGAFFLHSSRQFGDNFLTRARWRGVTIP